MSTQGTLGEWSNEIYLHLHYYSEIVLLPSVIKSVDNYMSEIKISILKILSTLIYVTRIFMAYAEIYY